MTLQLNHYTPHVPQMTLELLEVPSCVLGLWLWLAVFLTAVLIFLTAFLLRSSGMWAELTPKLIPDQLRSDQSAG